jgi:hypothetical protein
VYVFLLLTARSNKHLRILRRFSLSQESFSTCLEMLSQEPTSTRDSAKLVLICLCWYTSSLVSSSVSKSILKEFPAPITLTITQFGSAVILCHIYSWASRVLFKSTVKIESVSIPLLKTVFYEHSKNLKRLLLSPRFLYAEMSSVPLHTSLSVYH